MKLKLPFILSRANKIERQIDDFFDKVVVAGLLFKTAIDIYLKDGVSKPYLEKLKEVERVESQGDHLRRDIEATLYRHTLIPDLRSDVLTLLEEVDKLINRFEASLFKFEIEQPQFPSEHQELLRRLVSTVCESVEQIIHACRAFFRDQETVRDYTAKVEWLESEADKISSQLLKAIFNDPELDLAQRMHLRYFVERIDDLANAAEDISDNLTIYVIKRRV